MESILDITYRAIRDQSSLESVVAQYLLTASELGYSYPAEFHALELAADSLGIQRWLMQALHKVALPPNLISLDLGVADFMLPMSSPGLISPDVVLGATINENELLDNSIGWHLYLRPDYETPSGVIAPSIKRMQDLTTAQQVHMTNEGFEYSICKGLTEILVSKALVRFCSENLPRLLEPGRGVFLRGGYHQDAMEILGFHEGECFTPCDSRENREAFVSQCRGHHV